MIEVTSGTVTARVRGLAVYLDNWALNDLAEGDASQRGRFIAALCGGSADLMFSVANAVELAGPQGKSFDLVKSFLNEVGPNWFPVDTNVVAVVEREQGGADKGARCVSEDFMKAYFAYRTAGSSPGSRSVIDMSQVFCGLGPVLDWVAPHCESIRKQREEMDNLLKESISKDRAKHKQNPFQALPFDASKPASFTFFNLLRALFAKSNQLKRNDGLDFFHAVMASSYASVAALDRPWKGRIENLPKPNRLARIYSRSELSKMVTDIESWVTQNPGR